MTTKKTSRSGTKWTEEQYRAAGWHQKKLRLSLEAVTKLEAAAHEQDRSQSELVDELIRERL